MKAVTFSLFAGALLAGIVVCATGPAAAESASAKEMLVHSFGNKSDGQYPYANLIGSEGTFYGTTYYGGTRDRGAVFALDPKTGAETVLHSFGKGSDGDHPIAAVTDVKGILYGTTNAGGAYVYGTVFALDLATGKEMVLHSFGNGTDGQYPATNLIDVKGTLYGTTAAGGAYGLGTAFAIDPSSGAETVLYSFGSGTDGQDPSSGFIDVKGTLYGSTLRGGAYGGGTVFAFDPNTGTETILHSFGSGTDGLYPLSLIDVKGTFYGTTETGGANAYGTVFALDPQSGTETILYSFRGGSDGWDPAAGVAYVKGMLYGTTPVGGGTRCNGFGCGTVFAVDPGTGAETVVHAFTGGSTDGRQPEAALIDMNGTLYGTTTYGGSHGGVGTVFALKP